MTVDAALTKLHHAIVGDDPAFPHALAAARDRSGVPDEEFPEWLPRAIATLAEHSSSSPQPIGPGQRVVLWLIMDFVDLFPTAQLLDEPEYQGLAIGALGRALVIHTGDHYGWEVTAWPPPPAPQLRVIDAIIPSVDQIREWAYDPWASLAYQYKEFGLENPIYLELLIDLAADPKCAKREYILSVLGTIIASFCPGGGPLMAHARDRAKATGESRLAAWASDLDRMLSYAKGCGPVAHDEAQEIARIVLIGVRRPHLVLDESTVDGWWQFCARAPDGEALDCVYTHMATGNLFWARRVLAVSELRPYEIATMRTTALGECFGGPTSV